MNQSTTPTTRPRRLLRYLDIGLALFILGFIAVVLITTINSVPMVWPYLLLISVHNQLARLALVLALVMLALAAYIGFVRKGDVSPLFRRAVYIIFGTLVIQALAGVAMWLVIGMPAQHNEHVLYGIITALLLPLLIVVETTTRRRPAMLTYVLGFALLTGLVVRSIMTAG